jgi:RNA polymerase sigma-70 factor, ECF subfamily
MNLEILLSAIKARDKNAFNALYDETINRVYSLALKITRSDQSAEEVVADVYLQVWRQADQYDSSKGAVIGWLMLICRSRALDLLRQQKRVNEKNEEYHDQSDIRSDVQPDILEALDKQTAVYDALSQLNGQQQQLLALAYFRGYSHNEMVRMTGLPLGTIKTNLRRALILMHDYLTVNSQTTARKQYEKN